MKAIDTGDSFCRYYHVLQVPPSIENSDLPPDGEGETGEIELMRSSKEERDQQVKNVETFRETHAEESKPRLRELQKVARERKNTFAALMEAGKVCSLGFMSHALYDVGGEYRRNM